MQGWVISAVLSFLIRQIGKYGASLDWDKVKADAHKRIDDLLPDWLEPAFESLADGILDAAKEALSKDSDLLAIAQAVADGDLPAACRLLLDLVKEVASPSADVAKAGLQTLLDDSAKPSEPKG